LNASQDEVAMNTGKITILLLALFVFQLPALAQDPKQQLNDQLWEAARKGDAAAVAALIDKGADVNAKFRYGTTALFKAAERGNTDVVKVLLARGADVTVKDSFYGTSAMTWALDHDHDEIVRVILEKAPQNADEVLLTGARENKVGLVRIALEKNGATPGALTSALVAATTSEPKNDEIVELLKKAGAVPPLEVDAATLQSYVGKYKNDAGREVTVSVKDNKLMIAFNGPPFPLMAVDKTTFKPAGFDGLNVAFKLEGEKVTGVEIKQGPNSTLLNRVEEAKPQ
jgi:ankyrin repeat protein